mmetsp:Transcript_38382/g.69171  ORF Transcript_38382/g.69171 Transcript_38382/m.69171 type:complete len:283 (+) Transcript_38382:159-1007(+)|eukprot:CAMPEP_0201877258 /NCGR_PEP_ID=MMETSP0902-20130614/8727_1 /ASSEMBLY_ACC=CAM_ASM_000551 /TAXON_ID=420261 /ORGANISM="Thalassiosira antarctica, Strain CCMP982" /LENGTH=282 /DNA_ID=CAMNT_0048404683 /DNA_START=48 /DNA_END=896 /DNA_ORIENTATION=+
MAFSLPATVIIFVVLFVSVAAESPSSSRKTTYAKASFVPPAAPTLVSPLKPIKSSAGWPSAVNHPSRGQQQIVNGYGTYRAVSTSTSLFAKKKKGGDPVAKKAKIQVKLLETVPNIGQNGDIIFVSSAVFQNQLKLSNKARLVSAEEMIKLEQEKEEQEQEMKEMAIKTKSLLDEAMLENLGGEDQCEDNGDICGVALSMKRKAGPEGNLFGGVNPKMVMEALKEKYPEGSWDGKQVKLAEVKDVEGKDVKKKDIKHIGEYTLSVSLGSGVDVTFILSISAE